MTNKLKWLFILLLSLPFGCTSDEQPPSRTINIDDPEVTAEDSDCSAALKLADDEEADGEEADSEDAEDDENSGVEKVKEDCKDTVVAGFVDDGATTINVEKVPPATDEEAFKFLIDTCGSCHNNEDGQVKSFWAINVEDVSRETLTNDPMAPTAYYSLVVKAKGIVGKPRGMPPNDLSDKKMDKLLSVISWFDQEMPTVSQAGIAKHGGGLSDDGEGTGVLLNFKCDRTVSFRKFLNRITNDAFNRPPTEKELKLAGHDPDDRVTPDDRKMIVSRLFKNEDWKEEFMEVGLHKFSDKISGAGDMLSDSEQLAETVVTDLKEEFYQYLLKNVEKKSWKDILLQDTVMVSPNTAPLYEGCTAGSGWTECELKAPRGSYFTTAGYLRSKPSSFLVDNNNYGRAALMHFVISGDVFKAAFNGDKGDDVKELPECLQDKDWRGTEDAEGNFAPFGAMTIPASGNLCQSCHIDRQMAAGSVLFRPFDEYGKIWSTTNPISGNGNFANAVAIEKKYRPDGIDSTSAQVDEAFLLNLLEDEPKVCVPPFGDQKAIQLKTVKDLAEYIIGDGRALAGGLARHMPRAMSNLLNTTEEIIIKVNKAYAAGEGKLIPIFKAYFASETYACEARGAE